GRLLGRQDPHVPDTTHHNEVDVATDKVGRQLWEEGDIAFRVAVLQDEVLPLHVPQRPQALLPGVVATPPPEPLRTVGEDPAAANFPRLLRLDGERCYEDTQGESDEER